MRRTNSDNCPSTLGVNTVVVVVVEGGGGGSEEDDAGVCCRCSMVRQMVWVDKSGYSS